MLYMLTVDIPLSLCYFHHPPTPIGPFPAYHLPPPLSTSSLDTYTTSILLCLGLLIPDDGGSTHLWNVGWQSFYTAVQPRRQLWTSKNLVVKSTMFRHRSIHKYTWTTPDGQTHNQIDHVLIDRRWHSSVLDVRSFFRGADCDTDHDLVLAKIGRDW
jgi:hypothetical protein